MNATQRIVFMPYVWRLRGKNKALEPGSPIMCQSEGEALRWIEKIENKSLSVAGGQVVRMLVDEAAGEYGEPEFLASAGTVPSIQED
ncbi:hypothetical protein HK17_11880 [Acetobacter indonesiensis]|uniref:Uncharacterized protein n=1 Tax=Acetobacter indonesiensis TaxID=104101 RepID=A0A252AXP7_9PROT|nr:hypothetical protein HK17_11880 [Acetobacter indonesiensis]